MADRGLASATAAALDDTFLMPVHFVELRLAGGTVYLHTDVGDMVTTTPVAATWTGVGDLGTITEGLAETDTLEIAPFRATLSGIDATIRAAALDPAEYANREIRTYFAIRDVVTCDLLDPPFETFAGRISELAIAGAQAEQVHLTAESELVLLNRSSNRFLTNVQLQRDYFGDKGLEFADQMRNLTLTWGPPDTTQRVDIGAPFIEPFPGIEAL